MPHELMKVKTVTRVYKFSDAGAGVETAIRLL